jgi:hypothetical protein
MLNFRRGVPEEPPWNPGWERILGREPDGEDFTNRDFDHEQAILNDLYDSGDLVPGKDCYGSID